MSPIIQLYEQFMQAPTVKCRDSEIPPTGELNDPTETRYQTNKITNIFHRETLSPLYYSISTNNLKMSAMFKAY